MNEGSCFSTLVFQLHTPWTTHASAAYSVGSVTLLLLTEV
jgi:hypothetical protein